MQIEIDFTEYELENLNCKIDKLDPITQAEKVMEYLGKNYTQKQLGEKVSKTRDWIAKRVQFIRALKKLSEAEQKKAKKLVQDSSISLDVIILIANTELSLKQRQNIIAKHPTVSEARRLIDEYRQSQSSEAKVRVLERQLSKAYIEFEEIVVDVLISLGMTRNYCGHDIPSSLDKEIVNFLKVNWFENYRYGLEVHIRAC
ncbi:hypothetical protein H8E77_27815 [bacterium]|nr:hypothetical protein [bacterium]